MYKGTSAPSKIFNYRNSAMNSTIMKLTPFNIMQSKNKKNLNLIKAEFISIGLKACLYASLGNSC